MLKFKILQVSYFLISAIEINHKIKIAVSDDIGTILIVDL